MPPHTHITRFLSTKRCVAFHAYLKEEHIRIGPNIEINVKIERHNIVFTLTYHGCLFPGRQRPIRRQSTADAAAGDGRFRASPAYYYYCRLSMSYGGGWRLRQPLWRAGYWNQVAGRTAVVARTMTMWVDLEEEERRECYCILLYIN